MAKKIELRRLLAAIDSKDYDFYDKLDAEEKKAFSAYLAMRYEATVSGSPELQEWFLRATNERVNVGLFDINKHPKLQWLAIVSASPGIPGQYHQWIGMKKKGAANGTNKIRAFLAKQFPTTKEDELDMLVALNSKKDVKQLAIELGLDDKQIKSTL